jgi:hypothetical protein
MDTDVTNRALSREWLTGLIVIAGGFVIAIAVAAWLTLTHKPAPVAGQVGQPGAAATGQASGTDPTQVCRTALANAQNFGVLPAYGTLADANPKETSVQGRYNLRRCHAIRQICADGRSGVRTVGQRPMRGALQRDAGRRFRPLSPAGAMRLVKLTNST